MRDFINAIEMHVMKNPSKTAYVLLDKDLTIKEELSYQQLWTKVISLASYLTSLENCKKSALIIDGPGSDFLISILACFSSKIIATPTGSFSGSRAKSKVEAIFKDIEPGIVLSDHSTCETIKSLQLAGAKNCAFIDSKSVGSLERADVAVSNNITPDTMLIQYSSGSSGFIKGVEISRENMAYNQEAIKNYFEHSEDTVMITWLPINHDMGLIGGLLQPLYVGGTCVQMEPSAFLSDPISWLRAIDKFGGTTSGAPNFAYEICANEIAMEPASDLDLSSWKVAFNGAEPVRLQTMTRFTQKFQNVGFRMETFLPCYGLAEATLFVTGRRGVSAKMLSEDSSSGRHWVSVGKPLPGIEVQIFAVHAETPLQDGMEGEICIAGKSITLGYWNRATLNAQKYFIPNEMGNKTFLRTGDIGVIVDGELYVKGRVEETLFIRGRHFIANEIEEVLESRDPRLVPSGSSIHSDDTNDISKITVVAEVQGVSAKEKEVLESISKNIKRTALSEYGFSVDSVTLVRRGLLARTTSGKKIRSKIISELRQGQLRFVYTDSDRKAAFASNNSDSQATKVEGFGTDYSSLTLLLKNHFPDLCDHPETTLLSSGADSLDVIRFSAKLKKTFGIAVTLEDFLSGMTIGDVRNQITLHAKESDIDDLAYLGSEPDVIDIKNENYLSLWLQEESGSQFDGYMHIAFELPEIKTDQLQRAFRYVLNSYPILRKALWDFSNEADLKEAQDLLIEVDLEDNLNGSELNSLVRNNAKVLEDAVWIVSVLRQPKSIVLAFSVHHSVVDFWSANIILKAFFRAYASQAGKLEIEKTTYKGTRPVISPPPHRLIEDYISLLGDCDLTPLKTQNNMTSQFTSHLFCLDEQLYGDLKKVCVEMETTIFVYLYSLFHIFLAKNFSRESGMVGFMHNNREDKDAWDDVGLLASILLSPLNYMPGASLKSNIEQTHGLVLKALASRGVPYHEVIKKLRQTNKIGGKFSLPAVFSYQHVMEDDDFGKVLLGVQGIEKKLGEDILFSRAMPNRMGYADLNTFALDDGKCIWIRMELGWHDPHLGTAKQLAQRFQSLIRESVGKLNITARQLSILSIEDKMALSHFMDDEKPENLHHVVENFWKHVSSNPDSPAIRYKDKTVTYAELDLMSDKVAGHLATLGFAPGERIGVCLNRNEALVATLLGIFKIRCAYVPLELTDPPSRVEQFVKAAGVKGIICENGSTSTSDYGERGRILIEDIWQANICGFVQEKFQGALSDVGYVIFTSGSTAFPKAIFITHRNLAAFLQWGCAEFNEQLNTVAFSTRLTFDLSVFELFLPLVCGKKILILNSAFDPIPQDCAPVLLNTVPSIFKEVLKKGQYREPVPYLNFAGEPLDDALVEEVYKSTSTKVIRNLYGPAECTTYSTCGVVQPGSAVTVGKPIAGTQVYILDDDMAHQPIGVMGEIYIGGASVARGYAGSPMKTAECFLPDPFSNVPGERMYRTGDFGMRDLSGNIHFYGRKDSQIKLRGIRIDLVALEKELKTIEQVQEAVVRVVQNNCAEDHLVAYVQLVSGKRMPSETLTEHMRKRVPEYMVPYKFIFMDSFPLTVSGKLDKSRLPSPDWDIPAGDTPENAGLVGPIEEILGEVWKALLQTDVVTRHSDFFNSGGHSLLATRLSARINDLFDCELSLKELFESSKLLNQARLIEQRRRGVKEAELTIPPIKDSNEAIPLAFGQQGIWTQSYLDPNDTTFNVPVALDIIGKFDLSAFGEAVNHLVSRHELLRSYFPLVEGTPVQKTAEVLEVQGCFSDLSGYPEEEREPICQQAIADMLGRGFDVTSLPLLEWYSWKFAQGHHRVLLKVHHIIVDGWSLSTFAKELSHVYNSIVRNTPFSLPALTLRYADYAAWQHDILRKRVAQQQQYWQLALESIPAEAIYSKHDLSRCEPVSRSFELDEAVVTQLEQFSKQNGVTLYITFLSVFGAILSRYIDMERFVIASPVSNRPTQAAEEVIGVFFNTLPLVMDVRGNPSFDTLLNRVKSEVLGAYDNKDVPLHQILRSRGDKLLKKTSVGLLGMLTFQNFPAPEIHLAGTESTVYPVEFKGTKSDWHLTVWYSEKAIKVELMAADKSAAKLTETIEAQLKGMVSSLLSNNIEQVGISTQDTKSINTATGEAEYSQLSILGSIQKQMKKRPGKPALVSENRILTYSQLEALYKEKARLIISKHRESNKNIGIVVNQNNNSILSALAILATNNAYVPIENEQPDYRIKKIIEHAEVSFLIVDKSNISRINSLGFSKEDIVCIDGDDEPVGFEEPVNLTAICPAYIIYTSGSTGAPKGVIQNQKNVLSHTHNYINLLDIKALDNIAMIARPCTDAGIMDIYGALVSGATLHIWDVYKNNVATIWEWLTTQHISILHCTPSFLRVLPEHREIDYSYVRAVALGGEKVRPEDILLIARLFGEDTSVFCLYGPTECTTAMNYYVERAGDWQGSEVPLGAAVGQTSVSVLDENGNLSQGEGEVVFRGPHLADGYWRDPSATESAFRFLNQSTGEKVYFTRDIARYNQVGELISVGRKSHHVKIRGNSVVMDEVENELRANQGVKEAVVRVVQNNCAEDHLVAYVQLVSGKRMPSETLTEHMRKRVPEYMVPYKFIFMDSFPLTVSGKLDKSRLPSPDWDIPAGDTPENAGLVGPIEEILGEVWKALLQTDVVTRHSDFFNSGGHSLLATRLSARINDLFDCELSLKELFESSKLLNQARLIEQRRRGVKEAELTIPPIKDSNEAIPLAFGQQGIWTQSYLDPNDTTFNVPVALDIIGKFDLSAFGEAVNHLVSRHELLRSYFPLVEGTPVQKTAEVLEVQGCFSDLSGYPEEEREPICQQAIADMLGRGFDVTSLPLLEWYSWKFAQGHHRVLLKVHHIIVDGWSLSTFAKELSHVYNSIVRNTPFSLPALTLRYADYAAWQHDILRKRVAQQQQYWQLALESIPAEAIYSKHDLSRCEPVSRSFELDEAVVTQLEQFSKQNGVTLYITFLSVFGAILSRYIDMERFVIASPVSNRPTQAAEEVIGVFFNTLPLVMDVRGNPSFDTLLNRVKSEVLGAYDNKDVPLHQILKTAGDKRLRQTSVHFSGMLTFQNFPAPEIELDNATSKVLSVANTRLKSDWSLSIWKKGNKFQFTLLADGKILEPSSLEHFYQQFLSFAKGAMANSNSCIDELSRLPDNQRRILTNDFNKTEVLYHLVPFDHLVIESIYQNPEAPALIHNDTTVNYAKLGSVAAHLARHLKGVESHNNRFVPVILDNPIKVPMALLAVAMSGLAFIPISSSTPPLRLKKLFREIVPKVVITDCDIATNVCMELGIELFDVQDVATDIKGLRSYSNSDQPAYAIYTSGSTGEPKGAMIAHRSLSNRLHWMNDYFGADKARCVVQTTQFEFDSAIWQVFWPLMNGGKVVLGGGGLDGLSKLPEMIYEHKATLVDFVPSSLQVFLRDQPREIVTQYLDSLRCIIVGGEKLTPQLLKAVRSYLPKTAIVNLYGPTEATIGCIAYKFDRQAPDEIPIGKPISNVKALIVDKRRNLVPIGVSGELLLSGECVGLGYINQKANEDSFVETRFWEQNGEASYLTGDLAKMTEDGNIFFQGRIDEQIKISGFRVHPLEIENAMKSIDKIEKVVVLYVEKNAGGVLRAIYSTEENIDLDKAKIAERLSQFIPEWMIPHELIQTEFWPRTAGGKIDKNELLKFSPSKEVRRRINTPTSIQTGFEHIWKSELKLKELDLEKGLFELGADSLTLVRIFDRMKSELNLSDFYLKDIFSSKSLRELLNTVSKITTDN